jgi:glycosyltransferase involved in cell wall biosynthesis
MRSTARSTWRVSDEHSAPRVLFLGTTYAGWKTRFLNLKSHTEHDGRISPTYRAVTGWQVGGAIERLPWLPSKVRGRLRGALEASTFASLPRPDVIWLGGVSSLITPHLWAQLGRLRRPVVYELDWTLEQQEAFAPTYYGRPPRTGAARLLARINEQLVWRTVTLFTPMSTWAAASLRRQGVPAERIHVLHPGVDLAMWKPRPRSDADTPDRPLRLLFVGGDFARKGGPTLVQVFRERFAGRCELDLVTHASVEPTPGMRVHRAEPNSTLLHQLYAHNDVLVLPTQADCFGHVVVEALASGLPVIATDVGGISDIIDNGVTGWLIKPGASALVDALEHALQIRPRLLEMGRRGRTVAEQRFNGPGNDERLVGLLVEQAARYRAA